MPKHAPPYLGAAYYPEDWPLEQIDDDIALMQQAGMNVMRIAEFAWSRMEPREGEYDFAWLHTVVDKLGAAGIATILGTPTATPPLWLTERYPEVLGVDDQGVARMHGARRHFCPTSPVYREHCARIVTRMAEQFGKDPNVIGWQIDNEVYVNAAGPIGCCCPTCHRQYQQAMRARYGSIEALNAAWCADLWSQTYDSFGQLPVPRTDTWHHPALKQTWMEFQSDAYVDYVGFQADILHRLARQPVGTDMMPMLGVDYGRMNRKLDVVQFNHYYMTNELWYAVLWMDYLRPLKDRPFWNTETSACWFGQTSASGYCEPGFCRANSWLAYALGGEANLYWLWRAHRAGQELSHGSIVSSAGRPLHIFGEVQDLAAGLKASAKFLTGTRPSTSGLALHYSCFAWNFFQQQPVTRDFLYEWSMHKGLMEPMMQAQLRPDVIDPAADLSAYRLLCSPYLPALDEGGLRERLKAWIEAGGTWVVGPMSDIRDLDGGKFTHAPYGSLEQWAGVYCKYEIPGHPRTFKLRWADGREAEGSVWFDGLEPRGAKALATYTEGPLAGLAAVTERKMGKGRVILLGTMPAGADMTALLGRLAAEVGIQPAAEASGNLVVAPRGGKAGRGLIAVEVRNRPATLTLPQPATDLLTGQRHRGQIDIEPFGVRVLKF